VAFRITVQRLHVEAWLILEAWAEIARHTSATRMTTYLVMPNSQAGFNFVTLEITISDCRHLSRLLINVLVRVFTTFTY